MKIKEFAVQEGVTTQAVYKLLKTHDKALKGHVVRGKKSTELDAFAVNYLQQHMVGNTVIVADRQQQEEIQKLKADLKAAQDELIVKNAMLMQTQQQLIEERNERLQLEDKSSKVDEMQAELNRYQPLFGSFYRKK